MGEISLTEREAAIYRAGIFEGRAQAALAERDVIMANLPVLEAVEPKKQSKDVKVRK